MTLREALSVLRLRWRLVAIAGIIGLGVLVLYSATNRPEYEAQSLLYVSAQGQAGNTQSAYQGSLLSADRVKTYQELLTSRAVLAPVISQMRLDETVDSLARRVSTSSELDTVLISLTVREPDPAQAAAVANAISSSFLAVVTNLEQPVAGAPPSVVVRPVQPAVAMSTAVSPTWFLNVVGGTLAGLLIGIGVAFLSNRLDNTIKDKKGVEDALGLRTLASVPINKYVRNYDSEVARDTVLAEAFKQLRTSIQFSDINSKPTVLMVSSPNESEGKSTTSIGLSAAFAQAGRKTLLVEADLRKPRFAERLDVEAEVGLTNVLFGHLALNEAVQRVDLVDVLCSGPVPSNPSEVLGSAQMMKFVSETRERYDYIVFDCPPIRPVTDSAVLGVLGDGVVLVVRAGQTTSQDALDALSTLRAVQAVVLGAVLNGCAREDLDRYEYGYSAASKVNAREWPPSVLDRPEYNGRLTKPSPRPREPGAHGARVVND